MSRDLQIAWLCPHVTVGEHVELEEDHATIRTPQPIAAAGLVRLFVDGEETPAAGLQRPARLAASSPGPYRLGTSAEVVFSTPEGRVTPTLAIASTYRAEDVARAINHQGGSVTATVVNGRVVVEDASTVGPKSFVRVSGAAASVLGFSLQTGATGRTVIPRWWLTQDEFGEGRFVRFEAPLRGQHHLAMTYTTAANHCRRCGGTRVENDFRYDQFGEAFVVDNENLLYQACLKALLTIRGSNPYSPAYGSTIQGRVGSKSVAGIAGVLAEDVRQTLRRVQVTQQHQAKSQLVTSREKLLEVVSVQVSSVENDLTSLVVDVVLRNAARETVSLSVVFTVPGVVALPGAQGAGLG